jgi:hypothetical protein
MYVPVVNLVLVPIDTTYCTGIITLVRLTQPLLYRTYRYQVLVPVDTTCRTGTLYLTCRHYLP